jgi:hypothetical protein
MCEILISYFESTQYSGKRVASLALLINLLYLYKIIKKKGLILN